MARSEDPLLGSLNEWESDSPGKEFRATLDQFKDELSKALSNIPLADIRRKCDRYAKRRASLLAGHPQLEHLSSNSPVRRVEREFALYEAFIDAAKAEIALRSRRAEAASQAHDVAVHSNEGSAGKKIDPEVAKRRALVKANPGTKAQDMCETFDRAGVLLPQRWLDAGFRKWIETYKNPKYRPRIDVLISKDKGKN